MKNLALALLLVPALAMAGEERSILDDPDLFPTRLEEPVYKPEGRRDPFVPLSGSQSRRRTSCPFPGLGALPIEAASLRGIVETRGQRVALLAGPEGRSYFAHTGERLCDGEVASIGTDSVALRQEVVDPLSTERSREVTRVLHP